MHWYRLGLWTESIESNHSNSWTNNWDWFRESIVLRINWINEHIISDHLVQFDSRTKNQIHSNSAQNHSDWFCEVNQLNQMSPIHKLIIEASFENELWWKLIELTNKLWITWYSLTQESNSLKQCTNHSDWINWLVESNQSNS